MKSEHLSEENSFQFAQQIIEVINYRLISSFEFLIQFKVFRMP